MPKLPPSVQSQLLPGLDLLHQGKVRDTYALPEQGAQLVVASDRISIFDFVLNAQVPLKGEILMAMNHYWRTFFQTFVPQDLLDSGGEVKKHLPPELQDKEEVVRTFSRATVVRRIEMIPCEAIVRGCLTGSALKPYHETHRVCGHRLPTGLQDGDILPSPLFTPTTKAEVGHDEHMSVDEVGRRWGFDIERSSLQIFAMALQHARSRGIVLADTKFEFGRERDLLMLADEILTPDSSRYWDLAEWEATRLLDKRRSPTPFDKQLVREWGKSIGIHERDPLKEEDVAWVHAQEVPEEILRETTLVYRYIFSRLTGTKLEDYQRAKLGLKATPPKVKIEVISGSESDIPQMLEGLQVLSTFVKSGRAEVRRHVISCHRNPEQLARYARELPKDHIVIAGAGMAAALPGILRSFLIEEGKPYIPVIGVAFTGKDETATKAAQLSIEQLPGRPVMLDPQGRAYTGSTGFRQACISAVQDEFYTRIAPRSLYPAKFNLPLLPAEE